MTPNTDRNLALFERARRDLERMGVEVRLNARVTNITPQDAPRLFEATPPPFKIAIGTKGTVTRICRAYAEANPGEAFGILGSMGFLEIAVNRGSASQLLGTAKGTEVNVVF